MRPPRCAPRPLVVVMGLVFLVTVASPVTADSPDSRGTDFWLGFASNAGTANTGFFRTLFITGDIATTGTVEAPGIAFSAAFSVSPGSVTSVGIPAGTSSIHVIAAEEVTVYVLNFGSRFSSPLGGDAYLGLPTDALGTEYIVLGYGNPRRVPLGARFGIGTEFAVVATADGTAVTITPSVTTDTHVAGVPYTVLLNQGQIYQLVNTCAIGDTGCPLDQGADLSGTVISSTKPIAVYGAHAFLQLGDSAPQHIVEQLPPTSAWGTGFATMPLATLTGGDTFRFIASTDDTIVSVNGNAVATLNRGELHEEVIDVPAHITSNLPVLVAQYGRGSSDPRALPFMMLIPPFAQFLDRYALATWSTTASGSPVTHFINVVAPATAVGLIMLDAAPIPATSFTAIESSGFSGAQVSIAPGAHHLAGPTPFGAFVYTMGELESQGYPAGMSVAPIARVTTIAIGPQSGRNQTGAEHCVIATVLDGDVNPLQGVRVDFVVTGAHNLTMFAWSAADGTAERCYTGAVAGEDDIVASVGDVTSNTATTTWLGNQPPDITEAAPTQACFWHPTLDFASVSIVGITDPEGEPLTITITGITSDEPTASASGDGGKNHSPDATGVGADTAAIRLERAGPRDGRVYEIHFEVSDGQASVAGSVSVGIAHDRSGGGCAVDSGQHYDATVVN